MEREGGKEGEESERMKKIRAGGFYVLHFNLFLFHFSVKVLLWVFSSDKIVTLSYCMVSYSWSAERSLLITRFQAEH